MERDRFDSNENEREDPVVERLLELKAASENVRPESGLSARIARRLDEQRLRHQLTVALGTAALAAAVSLVFWWDGSARLAEATLAAVFTGTDGVDP